jgi:methyl-accepting chemotaxis protein
MEEMGAMIAQTSQNAEQTATETGESLVDAANGKLVVGKMVGSMKDIASSNNRLQSIAKVIEDIKNKTKIINDIAFETRLLAFNASIEAARAGAHGRGFAVVAEEVGKLANVSGKAADEVRTLLEDSVAQVGQIIEETKRKVDDGERNTQACETAFVKMESSFARISHGIQRIAAATKEQESGVKQANRAISEMEKVTHANSRNAEKLSSQSSHLKSAATGLLENAVEMQMLVFGRSAGSRSHSKKPFLPTNHDVGGGGGGGGNAGSHAGHLKEPKDPKSQLELAPADSLVEHQSTPQDRSSEGQKESGQVDRNDSRWHAA